MKTIETKRVEAEIDNLEFGYWDDEGDTFVTENELVQKKFDLSEDAISSIQMFTNDLKESLGRDLRDIWERLDGIQSEIGTLWKRID